jgi:hypothetical protein
MIYRLQTGGQWGKTPELLAAVLFIVKEDDRGSLLTCAKDGNSKLNLEGPFFRSNQQTCFADILERD